MNIALQWKEKRARKKRIKSAIAEAVYANHQHDCLSLKFWSYLINLYKAKDATQVVVLL